MPYNNAIDSAIANISFKATFAPLSSVSIGGGANAAGSLALNQIEFQYGAGGFRHFIKSIHSDVSMPDNRLEFWMNNSSSANGSTEPNVNNFRSFSTSVAASDFYNNLSMHTNLIRDLATPALSTDATNKSYTDNYLPSVQRTVRVDVATPSNLATWVYANGTAGSGATLTFPTAAAVTIDGISIVAGMTILVVNQLSQLTQGLYEATNTGSGAVQQVIRRKQGFDTLPWMTNNFSAQFYVVNGTALAGTTWAITTLPATVGTNPVVIDPVNKSSDGQNVVIGGNFDINPWARGTSRTGLTTGSGEVYVADRFFSNFSTSAVYTVFKGADAPSFAQAGIQVANSIRHIVTTASPSVASGDFIFCGTKIEGYDWVQLSQRYITVSFWVKATVTGQYGFTVLNTAGDRGYVTSYVINAVDTWEFKRIIIPPSPTAGTWNYTNGIGLVARWWITAGSGNQSATTDVWSTNGYFCASGQANNASAINNIFSLDLVKIEPGYGATPWLIENKEQTDEKCARYYEKNYQQGTAPGSTITTGFTEINIASAIPAGSVVASQSFKVRKRANPTIVVYSPNTGTPAKFYGNSTDQSALTNNISETGFGLVNGTGSPMVSPANYQWYYTADAEL